MSITCKICNREFKRQITNSHLKTHGIATAHYKERFGSDSLTCPEYIKDISAKRSGKNNPMFGKRHSDKSKQQISKKKVGKPSSHYGPLSEQAVKNIQKGVDAREQRYLAGELERNSHNFTEEQRNKISKSVKQYAENNKEELSERGKRAYDTAVSNDNWIAPMERLKFTDPEKYNRSILQSKKDITKANKIRSEKLKQSITHNMKRANLELIKESKSENTNLWVYVVKCDVCDSEFSYTRQYFTDSKFNVECCPTCYPRTRTTSVAENEIAEYLHTLGINIQRNNRTILDNRKEVDIYCPDQKIAIEYNGLYWHSQTVLNNTGRDSHYDYFKFKELQNANITPIFIFEDEWLYSKDIVKSILNNKFGKSERRIFARKCQIKEIPVSVARTFLDENHIKGYNKCKVKLGLFFEDELLSVMTFSDSNISRKSNTWEIDRFAVSKNTSVIGGASKLWKAFLTNYSPDNVITYADSRWSDGDLYKVLGFTKIKETVPNYWYFLPNEVKRIHRYTLRKNKFDDPAITEYQNRLNQGYLRIWDCGNTKWEWKREGPN